MTDRVLITGVSGFVGVRLALQLLNRGHIVRGTVRTPERGEGIRRTLAAHGGAVERFEIATCNLESDDGWPEAMSDVRYLHHVASPFRLDTPRDPADLIRPAVGGTERAVRAALGAEVERIVLTSSIASIIYGHSRARTALFDGSDWTRLDGPWVPPYQTSKTLAERRAWELMADANRAHDLVSIHPGTIMGPLLDDDPGVSATLIQGLLGGSYPAMPGISMTIVDVRDVVDGHVQAMSDPIAGGQRFPFSSATLTFRELVTVLRKSFPEAKLPQRQIPDWLPHLMSFANREMRTLASEGGYHRVLDTNPAKRLLGRELIEAEAAVIATGRSLIEKGLVDSGAKSAVRHLV